jgi:predicted metal-binding protein
LISIANKCYGRIRYRWKARENREGCGGNSMTKLDSYAEKAKSLGISKAEIVDTRNVVVGNWVRLKCQYGCGGYGECLTCPPYSPTPEYTRKMIGEYSKGLLIQIENITLMDRPRPGPRLRKIVADLEREIFLDGYYKAFGMASGPCRFCKTCDTNEPCKHPYKARPSMEACGIDVYQTARNCGFELEVVRTEDCSYSYVALLLIT